MPAGRAIRVRVCAIGIALVVGGAIAGCSGPVPIPPPAGTGPLITVEARGGQCVDGPCGSTVTLERDGRVHSAEKPPNALGLVPGPQLVALDAAIAAADFEALRSRPFTGQCPTAFDGQELVFEFSTASGVQQIASCEVEIDFGSPLFIAVANALGAFFPLPLG